MSKTTQEDQLKIDVILSAIQMLFKAVKERKAAEYLINDGNRKQDQAK